MAWYQIISIIMCALVPIAYIVGFFAGWKAGVEKERERVFEAALKRAYGEDKRNEAR